MSSSIACWSTGEKSRSTLLGPPSSRRSQLSPGITSGANNCGGGVVVFIPYWGCVVIGVLTADSTRRRPFGHRIILPLQSASRLGVSSSSPPNHNGGAKSLWPGLTLATETLKVLLGICMVWNTQCVGFIIVAFPTSTIWPLIMYSKVHGGLSACEDMLRRQTSKRQGKREILSICWCDA